MENKKKLKITLFHCLNAFKENSSIFDMCEVKIITMACSSMTKDVHLLRAFEAGADAVIVLACPEKGCRYVQGSLWARKRVDYVKTILDDIGIDSRRLNIFNTIAKNSDDVKDIINDTISNLEAIGE
ncbi:MAG: hydrogenase iron-sulfur subunit [Desulfobacula sp.]|nr:hydrogenase iron-sulfur subunit [Desulfobacula sp.]